MLPGSPGSLLLRYFFLILTIRQVSRVEDPESKVEILNAFRLRQKE
jgi:hypothetical protein